MYIFDVLGRCYFPVSSACGCLGFFEKQPGRLSWLLLWDTKANCPIILRRTAGKVSVQSQLEQVGLWADFRLVCWINALPLIKILSSFSKISLFKSKQANKQTPEKPKIPKNWTNCILYRSVNHLWCVDPGYMPGAHQSRSITPSLAGQGRECVTKDLRVKIRTGRSLVSYCHRQHRLTLGKLI